MEREEVLEAKSHRKYQSALAAQQEGDYDRAGRKYKKLIQSKYLQLPQVRILCLYNINTNNTCSLLKAKEGEEGQKVAPPLKVKLRYLCFKNLAAIQETTGDGRLAMKNYLRATELDTTDGVVWYHVGCLALKKNNLALARYAFEKGLIVNNKHWLCLEKLMQVEDSFLFLFLLFVSFYLFLTL